MFIFAHLGIGSQMVKPWTKNLKGKVYRRAILLGTMLPDLIDKPLFYGLKVFTHGSSDLSPSPFNLISQTRTLGHTALFLILLTFAAILRKSKLLAALALGVATHLVLDSWSDQFVHHDHGMLQVLLWPLNGWHFPPDPYGGLENHLALIKNPVFFYGELVGIALLGWDMWTLRHPELIEQRRLKKKKKAEVL